MIPYQRWRRVESYIIHIRSPNADIFYYTHTHIDTLSEILNTRENQTPVM